MYRIVFIKQADKSLRRMPRTWANWIRKKLLQIADSPFEQHNNVTQLQGRPGYRLRVGDWRVIYEVDQDKILILVLRIGPC